MSLSVTEILIILVIVGIIFGAGKLPKVMGDLGQGIRNFKDGLKDRDAQPPAPTGPVSGIATDNPVATAPSGPVTRDETAPRS